VLHHRSLDLLGRHPTGRELQRTVLKGLRREPVGARRRDGGADTFESRRRQDLLQACGEICIGGTLRTERGRDHQHTEGETTKMRQAHGDTSLAQKEERC
jgi:hypothetical protein